MKLTRLDNNVLDKCILCGREGRDNILYSMAQIQQVDGIVGDDVTMVCDVCFNNLLKLGSVLKNNELKSVKI